MTKSFQSQEKYKGHYIYYSSVYWLNHSSHKYIWYIYDMLSCAKEVFCDTTLRTYYHTYANILMLQCYFIFDKDLTDAGLVNHLILFCAV